MRCNICCSRWKSSLRPPRADRVDKRRIYGEEPVDEYWMIDLDARAIERTTPGEMRAEILVDELVWSPRHAESALLIDLPAYFASVLTE